MTCPKCGYIIIKHSLVAECAKCDFSSSWKDYLDSIAREEGFISAEAKSDMNYELLEEKFFN